MNYYEHHRVDPTMDLVGRWKWAGRSVLALGGVSTGKHPKLR
jgi:hypothetical protein